MPIEKYPSYIFHGGWPFDIYLHLQYNKFLKNKYNGEKKHTSCSSVLSIQEAFSFCGQAGSKITKKINNLVHPHDCLEHFASSEKDLYVI